MTADTSTPEIPAELANVIHRREHAAKLRARAEKTFPTDKEMANAIHAARQAGLSMQDIADRIGVVRSMVYRWLEGQK